MKKLQLAERACNAVAILLCVRVVVPLFFQIMVDKVLVNRSVNTLNVLGIGIAAAIIFNGVLDFVRSYFE